MIAESNTRQSEATELLLRFAERTGLTGDALPDRYLWTDAFAVCTLMGLGLTELALKLIEQVHRTLGRHRPDAPTSGWLSGLTGPEAAEHPTRGGLRIGKSLPERPAHKPADERSEWDRDGQYFHYLTRWMHALDWATRVTGYPRFNRWARELAVVAHRAFTWIEPGRPAVRRMYWKMSVDLTRPLVASMGHHDPLDGYVTCLQMQATAASVGVGTDDQLAAAAADFAAMIPRDLATTDPLGIGGLLADAARLASLPESAAAASHPPPGELAQRVIEAARTGLEAYTTSGELDRSASTRLAFRELGLAIGLAAVGRSPDTTGSGEILRFLPLRDRIETFWMRDEHRHSATWRDHRNINDVMLATSIAPAGYLGAAAN